MKPTPRWLDGDGPDDLALRSALKAARQGPSAAQLDALSAKLAARRKGAPPTAPARPRRFGVVLGAALLVLGLSLAVRLAMPEEAPPALSSSPQEAAPRVPTEVPTIPAPSTPPPAARPPTPAPPAAHIAPTKERARVPSPTQRRQKAPAPGPQTDELTLLQAANRALLSEPARALSLALAHEAQFTQGIFAEEREAIAIEALFKLGRATEANTRRRRFDQRFPSSTYRQRLERVGADHARAP